jgi:catechol 2,3-dioxygenase-like lactoylglutathione lyase family enzyme
MTWATSGRGRVSSVESVYHPVISVSDMERSLLFYRDMLHLRVTFDDFHDPDALAKLFGFDTPIVRSVILECADRSEFELVEFKKPRGRTTTDRDINDAGIAALALRVTEIEELVARVTASGFTLSSTIVAQVLPDGATLKAAVCRGPDNVKVILVEPPEGRKSLAPGK